MNAVYPEIHGVFWSTTGVDPAQAGSASALIRQRAHVRHVRPAVKHAEEANLWHRDVNSERDPGRTPNYDRLKITSKGFQFLLEDRQTQLWQILMFYLALREASRPLCACKGP